MSLIKTNIDYSGKDVNLMISEAFAETLFYKTYGARRIESVKSKYFYFDISNSLTLGALECCPSTFDNMTLNQRSGSVCEFQMAGKVCHRDLIGTAREVFYGKGMNGDNILNDTVLIQTLTANILQTAANQWDNLILNGNSGATTGTYLDLCDGLLAKWTADSTVVDVVGVSGGITAGNVIDEMNRVINAVDEALLYNPNRVLKMGVALNVARAYQQATASIQSQFTPITEAQKLMYMGIELVPMAYLPASQMFLTYPENIIMIYDSEEDVATLNFYDKGAYSSCKEVEMVLNFRGANDYGFGKDIVWYHRP